MPSNQTNPMLMQSLRQQQMQGMGQPPMQGGGDMSMQEQFAPQAAPAPDYNPFDIGIGNAIQSARQTFKSGPDQDARSMRSAILSYGDSVGAMPKARGFMANLGQGLKSLSPAIRAHDAGEVSAEAENQAMADKILQYRAAEEARRAQMEQTQWNRDFDERRLSETKRAHNMMSDRYKTNEGGVSSKEEAKIALHEARKNIDSNNKYIDKAKPEIEQAEIKNRVMDKLATILKEESAAGGTPKDALMRKLKKLSGNDANLTQAAMLKKYFFKDIKGVAGNPNIKEWNDLVNTMITVDKNVDGTLSMIDFEKEQNEKKIKEFNALRKVLDKTKRRAHYDSQEVRDLINQELGIPEPQAQTTPTQEGNLSGMVNVKDLQTGIIFPVTREDAALMSPDEFEAVE